MKIAKQHEENGYLLTEYDSGTTTKELIMEHSPEPMPPSPPTEDELIQAQLLLDQAQILANQQAQDEVLAVILLEQARGGVHV